jgi:GxxExxY protein
MDIEALSFKVRGAIFEVYTELGPGLLESVYEMALLKELSLLGIEAKNQIVLPVFYKEAYLEIGFRMDILVEDRIVVEIKSVQALEDIHKKQLLTYLKLSNKTLGFLVNFNTNYIQDKISLIRIVNNYQQ